MSLDAAGRIAAWQHELLPVRGSVPAASAVELLVADLTAEETGSQKQMAPSVATGALHAETDRCAGCHPAPAASWRTSAHARAFPSLPPSMQGNLGCLPCHATGWGKGGYVDAERTPGLQSVTCTACHAVPRKHLSWPDRAPVPPVAAPTCRQCHTAERSPDFDFAQYWARIRH